MHISDDPSHLAERGVSLFGSRDSCCIAVYIYIQRNVQRRKGNRQITVLKSYTNRKWVWKNAYLTLIITIKTKTCHFHTFAFAVD